MEFGLKNIIYIVIFLFAIGLLSFNLKRLVSYLKLGKPENRSSNLGSRINRMIGIAFFQKKILREASGGFIHIAIFWGFIILLFSASQSVFTGFGLPNIWNYLGIIYSFITLLTDIFAVAIIGAILFAFIRRYVIKVNRLQIDDPHEKIDALIVLTSIFLIVTGLLFENAGAIVAKEDASNAYRPISYLLSTLISIDSASIVSTIGYWVHSLMILSFMNYLPYSKHFHVYSSVPNVFLSNGFPNKLESINFEDEKIEQYGVTDVQDFSWKTLLDSLTCTHCGRCTVVCPANITGKPLDPRDIMVNIRARMLDKMPLILERNKSTDPEAYEFREEKQQVFDKPYVGDYQNEEALWNCTSCGACMQECPVMNEHVPAIVEMRRSKVMMESEFPQELQAVFSNLENNGAPWQFSPSERADWTDGYDVPIASNKLEFDTLYWVGCAGSFDDRAKKVSQAFITLLNKAEIDYAILGIEESCNGDIARRAGNEYLADMLIKQNIEVLNQYKFKRIITTCPHCYNTFKNEYPEFGAKYEVIHHSELLIDLINTGKLKVHSDKEIKVAYHDSCYLGRYNSIYNAPRQVIKSIDNVSIVEPKANKDKGFCCGAGGGQMFMEETIGKRVNIERTEQLIEKSCDVIGINCPFCLTMIEDGLKTKDIENIKVKDIAEIIYENLIEK